MTCDDTGVGLEAEPPADRRPRSTGRGARRCRRRRRSCRRARPRGRARTRSMLARQLGVPQRQLQAEGHQLGVDAVRAADHRRVPVLVGARLDRRRRAPPGSSRMRSQASTICSACAVSTTSDEVRPKCSQRADGPDVLGHRRREGDHVVLRGLLDLVDAGDVERALRAQVARRFGRHDAGVGHRFGGRQLHLRARSRSGAARSRCGPSRGWCSAESCAAPVAPLRRPSGRSRRRAP